MSKAAQPTVTLKHLAASLAGDHEMPKKQSEAILNDLVGLLVKHLKRAIASASAGSAFSSCESAPREWAAIRPPASRSRSRRAGKSLSAPPKN